MGNIKRTLTEIPQDQLYELEEIFGNLTRIDMNNIPNKFADVISKTKETCLQQMVPVCVHASVGIERIGVDTVVLGNGSVLNGKMPPVLLEDSFEAVLFVATLQGFDSLDFEQENIVNSYFLDAWCSSMIETAGIRLFKEVEGSVSEQGLFLTTSWCPGQHQFPLENQKTIFEFLNPGELQVNLTESCMMKPVKSLSGMMGLTRRKDSRGLIACQFCDLVENCPSKRKDSCCTTAMVKKQA
jgi:hypothetical protein